MAKKTNNGLQNTTEKTDDLATLTSRNTGGRILAMMSMIKHDSFFSTEHSSNVAYDNYDGFLQTFL
jgi:hypothetical protein